MFERKDVVDAEKDTEKRDEKESKSPNKFKSLAETEEHNYIKRGAKR